MKLDIKSAINRRGMKQARLAETLDMSPGYISSIINNQKTPSLEVLEKIATILDVDIGALYQKDRTIAVAGRVGAGSVVELTDAYAKGGGLFHIECPEDLPATNIVAVEVVGDSMVPLIQPHDILLFTRHFWGVDEAAIGKVSICETEDGRALVKQILLGREKGTFDLHSANNTNQTEYGVRLKWAAPMRRHITKEDINLVQ